MKKWIIALASVAVLAAGCILGYQLWYRNNHIFVEDTVYEKELTFLDLRGTGRSLEYYEQVRSQLPDCEIRYDLPFQGGFYADDTTELTITALTAEEVELLDYLPRLKTVNAAGCTDYEQLLALQARRTDCTVHYTVTIGGEEYPEDTAQLVFQEEQPDIQELMEQLTWLPRMESIFIEEPEAPAAELLALRQAFPQIGIQWNKTAFDVSYPSDVTEIDLSGMILESPEDVVEPLSYFPELEKVIMCKCGSDPRTRFDNETMAAFREKMRPEYTVVWSMSIYGIPVRTDDTYFMPIKYGVSEVHDYQLEQLIYCEDMLCVDLGHMAVRKLDWVTGMPHLKYLIVADGPLVYIEPLSTCKELVYLELFDTHISDYTPLLGCTALEDLNVADTFGDIMVFKDMPWLKNLWINRNGVTQAEHDELQAALPNTRIESKHGFITGNGWRQIDNYFKMRDLLGMPYNAW